MNEREIIEKVKNNQIEWRGHVLRRMLERNISRDDVKTALSTGQVIEDYPDDYPFPSCLVLGYCGEKPLHIVCSIGQDNLWVITVYIPDPNKWENNFKTRR
ncbi:MAG: DUF4258 domain-containing protein [Pseudomonadota bacterium]